MGKDISKVNCTFHFCDGGSCRKAGSEQLVREARAYLRNAGFWEQIHTIKTRCNGRCEDAPTWVVQPGNFWYKNLDPAKGVKVLKSHLLLNEPLTEQLLFQPGWEKLQSDKEKPQEPAKFKRVSDPLLGELLLARMSSSEQYLFPLFRYLFERHEQLAIQYPGTAPFRLSRQPTVEFSDTYDIFVKSEEVHLQLAIAPIPQDAPKELQERKVGVVEVLVLGRENPPRVRNPRRVEKDEHPTKGIRMKNRKGKELLTIWLKNGQQESWHHILKYYLNMNPNENLVTEHEQL